MSDNSSKWYYQPSTGTVFQGKKTGWDDRMGPYDSEEEARAAMEKSPSATRRPTTGMKKMMTGA